MLDKLLFKTVTPGMFRLILAFIVVVFHSVRFLTIGHYAVYVFFILSGYWIFKMYNEKYCLYKNAYITYIISRLFRLLPVYWFILLLSLLIYLTTNELFQTFKGLVPNVSSNIIYNFLLIGVTKQNFMFLVPAWSLDVEIQFYILAPLLIIAFTNKKKAFLITSLFSILSITLINNRVDFLESYKILTYLPYFLIGGILSLFEVKFSRKSAKLGILFIGFILVINYLVPQLRTDYLLNRNATLLKFNYSETLNVIFSLLTIPFITNNLTYHPTNKRMDTTLSSMSFVVYLLHWPLLQLYAISVKNVSSFQKLLHLIVFYISTILLAWVITRIFDDFFEKKRKNWIRNRPYKFAK